MVGAYLQLVARVAGPGRRAWDRDGWLRRQQHPARLGSGFITSAQLLGSYDFTGSANPNSDGLPGTADPIPNWHLAMASESRLAGPEVHARCGFPCGNRLTGVHIRVGRGTPQRA